MRLVTYDFECFKHDWLVVFKDKESGIYTIIHNDPLQFQQCIDDDTIYVGFNNKHYDYFISKAVYAMFTPEQVHEKTEDKA